MLDRMVTPILTTKEIVFETALVYVYPNSFLVGTHIAAIVIILGWIQPYGHICLTLWPCLESNTRLFHAGAAFKNYFFGRCLANKYDYHMV